MILIKYFGGKQKLAKWIVEHFPPGYENMTYMEPFVGGGAVYLRKNPSCLDWINDLDPRIVGIWEAAQNDPDFRAEAAKLECSEGAFNNLPDTPLGNYARFNMSRAGMGKDFADSSRIRRGMPEALSGWLGKLDHLDNIRQRMAGIVVDGFPMPPTLVTCMDAIEMIEKAGPECLIYCDPPYSHDTRVSRNVYAYEAEEEFHRKLAATLDKSPAKVIISGYPGLYTELYSSWRKVSKKLPNHASQAAQKPIKEECLWLNYPPSSPN